MSFYFGLIMGVLAWILFLGVPLVSLFYVFIKYRPGDFMDTDGWGNPF